MAALAAARSAVRSLLPAASRTVATMSAESSQLFIRKPAPEFTAEALVNNEFKKVSLSDYKGKYVVLFFYPLDFTFVCPTEIIAFSDAADKFRENGAELLGVSVDSTHSHFAWANMPRKQGGLGGVNFPLISDWDRTISRKYNVLLEDDLVALRGLFLIDGKGILRHFTVNDLPVGRSVEETLRVLQAFQFTDVHGEVCPAGWQPGKDTMNPDHTKAQTYFSKHG